MKILLDTNVLISAFLSQGGRSADVIENIKDDHQPYYTQFIIDEFVRVSRKFGYSANTVDSFGYFIENNYIRGESASNLEAVCRDSDDDQVLADALINKIEVIITGDNDLLILKSYKGIRIIAPKDYWNL